MIKMNMGSNYLENVRAREFCGACEAGVPHNCDRNGRR